MHATFAKGKKNIHTVRPDTRKKIDSVDSCHTRPFTTADKEIDCSITFRYVERNTKAPKKKQTTVFYPKTEIDSTLSIPEEGG